MAIAVALMLVGGAAQAAPTPSYRWISEGGTDGPLFVRQLLPAPPAAAAPLALTRTIYLNRRGATLTPGVNDSRANTSTIVPRLMQVPGWNASEADWAMTVACMKQLWSPFDVVVTDIDPGTTPHVEAVFARSPADVGMTGNIGGVSPFAANCSVIETSIVFAFTDNLSKRPHAICEVMSQEIAHSYGLDHELLAADPMTYLGYAGDRTFQDRDVACGESTARPCGISGFTCRATQNSVQLLVARLGAANRDHQPPSIGISAPADSATVAAGFAITATATDNHAVKAVAFYVDGELVATRTQPPYQLTTDPGLVEGAHTIVVEATDDDGNAATLPRDIIVASPADPFALGCSTGGTPSTALIAFVVLALARRGRIRSRNTIRFRSDHEPAIQDHT